MVVVDLFIILILIIQAHHWWATGFIKGSFSLIGFLGGLVLGSLIAPFAVRLSDDPLLKLTIAMSCLIFVAIGIGRLAHIAGDHVSLLPKKIKLGHVDSALGSALGVIVGLIFIWLFASILGGTQLGGLNRNLRQSHILQAMDKKLPPAPGVIARVTGFIDNHGFPQVFTGLGPQPIEPVQPPSDVELKKASDAAAASTVRIEGIGCGGLIEGSGFVAANNIVVTNAHVVAGIGSPSVVDVKGYHKAQTIYFDKNLDLAILKTSKLAGKPLPLAQTDEPRGTTGAVLGYPGGGRLKVVPAAVLRQLSARGRDIYNQQATLRTIYELQTDVAEGNSGGPVVLPDGSVISVVFAKSESDQGIGYGLLSTSVTGPLYQAERQPRTVSTGQCIER
jgi:S1-C subfamily serine protease